jgi:hypothetical protein
VTRWGTTILIGVVTAVAALLAGPAAPSARAAEPTQFLGTLNVPADGTLVQNPSLVVRQGETYRFVITGTATHTFNTGTVEHVDAVYCFFTTNAPPGSTCTTTPPGPASVVPLFLQIGTGAQSSPGALAGRILGYQEDHTYDSTFVAPSTGVFGARARVFGAAPPATGAGGFGIVLFGPPPPPAPAPAAAVPPGSLPGQPPITGPPLFRIVDISLNADATFRHPGGQTIPAAPAIGWVLGAGDGIVVRVKSDSFRPAQVKLQALPNGPTFTIFATLQYSGAPGSEPARVSASFYAEEQPVLEAGRAVVSTAGARAQALLMDAPAAVLRTPVARVDVEGSVADVTHVPGRAVTTVGNVRGRVSVTPANGALRSLRLVPGQQVRVGRSSIGAPFALVPDLQTTIPSPRAVRAGPATATAPGRLSLRSLRSSKCVAVLVASARPARVLVTIFSGRRSVRLFGQRLVVFAAAGRKGTCIAVPARARTFNVRTPLRFAVGYALGARGRPGERPTRPVIRPITLVP